MLHNSEISPELTRRKFAKDAMITKVSARSKYSIRPRSAQPTPTIPPFPPSTFNSFLILTNGTVCQLLPHLLSLLHHLNQYHQHYGAHRPRYPLSQTLRRIRSTRPHLSTLRRKKTLSSHTHHWSTGDRTAPNHPSPSVLHRRQRSSLLLVKE